MDEIPIPTPEDIEIALERRKLSLASMLRRADLDAQTFRRWKEGRSSPTLSTVQRMKDAIESVPIPVD